jgi:hypothetical protein
MRQGWGCAQRLGVAAGCRGADIEAGKVTGVGVCLMLCVAAGYRGSVAFFLCLDLKVYT